MFLNNISNRNHVNPCDALVNTVTDQIQIKNKKLEGAYAFQFRQSIT